MPIRPADRWRELLSGLHTWKRGSSRAVHKPLLVLMMIARADAGASGRIRFADIQDELRRHLREFGPTRRSYHPEFPFWHLQHDGFWRVQDAASLPLKTGGNSPSRGTLLRADATGEVDLRLWHALSRSSALREELAQRLLEEFWPETVHGSIRSALGLPDAGSRISGTSSMRVPRDPRFRAAVLSAYQRCCAICGYDGRLADILLGLEAAHVKWRAYDGPDTVSNGMALCSFHHTAFDAGALSLSDNLRVLVSSEVSGRVLVPEMLYRFDGRPIARPQPGCSAPDPAFVAWHRKQVFRGVARGLYEEPGAESITLAGDHD
jgi:putative restriction endonuclease